MKEKGWGSTWTCTISDSISNRCLPGAENVQICQVATLMYGHGLIQRFRSAGRHCPVLVDMASASISNPQETDLPPVALHIPPSNPVV